MSNAIDILLATYNSGPLLAAQLDSILAQDYADWRLLISDGGSTDDTPERLRDYARRDLRIQLLEPAGRLGAMANFSRLLARATAPLIMFSDHDDVWLPDKISRSLRAYQAAPDDRPKLVFTDKFVTDADLRVIAPSHNRMEKLNTSDFSLNRLLAQNAVSGCVMLFDRGLAELAGPIPECAVMHDYFLTLVAALFGRIVYLDEPTMYYRQHGVNVLGAQGYGWSYLRNRLRSGREAIRERLFRQADQARFLLARFGDRLDPAQRELLTAFGSLREQGFWARRRTLWHYDIRKNGFLRNVGMFLLI